MPILLLLVSFATVSAVLYTPALPQISSYFEISEGHAQWTISIFLLGYCLGQLPYGPLANHFGRKKTIYLGTALAIAGSFIAFFSNSFEILCIGRFIQAIGSAVGLKVTFTMISDQRSGASATKMISLVTLAFGITPGLSVAVGGFITSYAGWKGCFLFLAIYSVFIALISCLLPETAPEKNLQSLNLGAVFRGYARQFKDSFVVLHAFVASLSTAMIYIFQTLAPYIGIENIGLLPPEYGLWNLIPSIGLITGSFLARYLAEKSSPRVNIIGGFLLALVGTIIMGISFATDYLSPWTLFFPQLLILIGLIFAWSNASGEGLSKSTDKSNASAVFQCINIAGAVVGVYLVSRFSPRNSLLLPAAYLIALAGMLFVWLMLKTHHARKKS